MIDVLAIAFTRGLHLFGGKNELCKYYLHSNNSIFFHCEWTVNKVSIYLLDMPFPINSKIANFISMTKFLVCVCVQGLTN